MIIFSLGKFLPFKAPLSSRYDQDIPEGNKFDIPMLLNYVEAMQLRVGLVVDLTKTDRFYDKRSLTELGIGHYKLKCEGYVASKLCVREGYVHNYNVYTWAVVLMHEVGCEFSSVLVRSQY